MDARLEELPFSRGIVLMVTAALVLAVLVIGASVALTAGGGSGPERPRSAAPPPPPATYSGSPDATGHSPTPRRAHRRPGTSSSTMVGTMSPSPSASRPASTAGPTSWWPPRDGRPHWHRTTPPPWWHRR
jgi:hypothetical protein